MILNFFIKFFMKLLVVKLLLEIKHIIKMNMVFHKYKIKSSFYLKYIFLASDDKISKHQIILISL